MKKRSQEFKDKIRKYMLGKKHSKETIEKMRLAKIGDKNPNWKTDLGIREKDKEK